MKKILVTGGSGFIGTNFINLISSKNYKILNIDKISEISRITRFTNHATMHLSFNRFIIQSEESSLAYSKMGTLSIVTKTHSPILMTNLPIINV